MAALALDQPETMKTARDKLPCSPREQEIIDLLHESMTADDLAERLAIPFAELASRLSLLEMKGVLKRAEGNAWMKNQ